MAHANHHGAVAPGRAAPERLSVDPDVRTPAGRPANADQVADGHRDFATEAARRKADATLIALFALAGFELQRLDADTWLVHRWDLSRELSQAELAQFAQRVGAAS
jgi:hypothetical protein